MDLLELPTEEKEAQGGKGRRAGHAKRVALALARDRNKWVKSIANLRQSFLANSSRKAKASIRRTVQNILDKVGGERKRHACITLDDVEKVGAVLKEAQYKAGPTYLAELQLMLVEAGGVWSQQHERMKAQVSRALKRAREVPQRKRQKFLKKGGW